MPTARSIRSARYDSKASRRYALKYHNIKDADIIARLDQVPSINDYIRTLIRSDIAGSDKPKEASTMKPTISSINAALPRFDALRRRWWKLGSTGCPDGREYLAAAMADLDEHGNVTDITLYAPGDAQEARHYYGREGTANITEQLEDAISAERLGEYSYDSRRFRAQIVYEIQQAIIEQQAGAASDE